MALSDLKITGFSKPVSALDDKPKMSAAALKAWFDGNSTIELKNAVNALIDALESAQGAVGIGAAGGTVQAELDACVRLGGTEVKYLRLNGDRVLETSADGVSWQATGSSGHVLLDADGQAMPQRSRMQFTNAEVDDVSGVTVIRGIQGDTGPKGDKGDKGDTGAAGPQGARGPVIVPSVDADGVMTFTVQDAANLPQAVNIRGPQGVPGVQGAQGVAGAQGPQGIQGVQGLQGPKGDKGDKGEQGEPGPEGVQGARGLQGVQGIQGEPGIQGPKGEPGAAGAQGPQGPQGEKGEDGADGRSFVIQDVYPTLGALKTAYPNGNEYAYQVTGEDDGIFIWSERLGDWTGIGKLQGPQGPQGPQGIQGPQGPKGDTGPAGAQGVQGVQGIQGEQGAPGVQGPKGDTGATGPEGPQGPQGIQGAAGPQGAQGVQGPAGQDGKSAYAAAVESGYAGTESALSAALAALPGHVESKANPHSVTAAQIGAASLDASGKVPAAQLPAMDYDPAGSAEAVQDNLNAHAGDGVKHITAAERTGWNAKGTPYRYTGTLTAAGWTGTGPYTQTVNVTGVTADMTPVADVVLTGDKDADTLVLEGWACVSRMTTAAGKVTAVCYEDKPGVNVPVSLTGCK